jgi:secretion/DNA translocation related TadE-like protein
MSEPVRPTVRERGSATVWVLAVGLLIVVVALASAAAGAAAVARHRAQSAADLGALAGAIRVIDGPVTACVQARTIATANGARLVACRLDGFDVIVTVEVVPSGVAAVAGVATASARAGPA